MFRRTKPSTLNLIKQGVEENKRPLKVLKEVENIKGGMMKADRSCDLPRNRRQIYNMKSISKVDSTSLAHNMPRNDTLAQVMMMCKETVSSSDAFVRCVEAAPEPMCILATNQ